MRCMQGMWTDGHALNLGKHWSCQWFGWVIFQNWDMTNHWMHGWCVTRHATLNEWKLPVHCASECAGVVCFLFFLVMLLAFKGGLSMLWRLPGRWRKGSHATEPKWYNESSSPILPTPWLFFTTTTLGDLLTRNELRRWEESSWDGCCIVFVGLWKRKELVAYASCRRRSFVLSPFGKEYKNHY